MGLLPCGRRTVSSHPGLDLGGHEPADPSALQDRTPVGHPAVDGLAVDLQETGQLGGLEDAAGRRHPAAVVPAR